MMVLLGVDIGTNEIRVQNGDSIDDIVRTATIVRIENVISFHESKRLYGSHAKKSLFNENGCNTFFYLKWLIGKKVNNKLLDEFVERSLVHKEQVFNKNEGSFNHSKDMRLFFNTSKEIKYFNCIHTLHPDELYTMILTNLRKQIITSLYLEQEEQLKCVLSVPFSYTVVERNILMNCCRLANIECLSLVNDTTAICVYYATTKRNLLSAEPRIVIVIDCGELYLQISYAAIWDSGVKVLHTYCVDDFGGKCFDYKLYERFCDTNCYKTVRGLMPESQLKATIIRECEKAKIFGFNSPFELRFTKDSSYMIYKEDFEQANSELFYLFAKHIRTSYEEFARRYSLPSIEPSKSDALGLIFCGATMKINKLKETANNIFKMDGKLYPKETISKACMIIANMMSSKKKTFTIIDQVSHDVQIRGSESISTLVSKNTQLPSKILIKNVEFSEVFKIFINKEIEYGQVHIKLKNSKAKGTVLISWKILVNANGVIEKISPICIKLDENNKEVVDSCLSYELKVTPFDTREKDVIKKMKTFDRLEHYEQNGSKERMSLQKFIYQSIQFVNELSKHLTNDTIAEFLSMLEEEEAWLLNLDSYSPTVCMSKLELLKKRINSIRKQKEIYDACLQKLDQYKQKITEDETTAQLNHLAYLNNSKSNILDDFQYKIFLKLVDDHRKFHKKFVENISHENILEIIVSPEAVQQKIDQFCKESREMLTQNDNTRSQSRHQYGNDDNYSGNGSDEEYAVPNYNKLERIRIKNANGQLFNNTDAADNDYQTLSFKHNNESIVYEPLKSKISVDLPDDESSENENDNNDTGNATERKTVRRLPINVKSLTIKGVEISSRPILFSLRIVNFRNITFPQEWDLTVKMDRKEYKVLLDPTSKEFENLQERFKPMNDAKHKLMNAWRIQNENLWSNFFTKKNKLKTNNELELFYGCDGAYFKHVCENNCQFRRSTFKCPDFGLGVYFYRNITDAHKNVKPYYGCYYMFVCKVAIGKSTLGTSSIAKLPKGYHTATNKKFWYNSSIFVVPKDGSDQIYPSYLLAYESND